MPRVARIVVPQVAHHITQRGNNRQDIFFTDDDRRLYTEILQHQCSRWGLSILGYCLMTNHVHLIATPSTEGALARAVGRTHWHYTQAINRLHNRSGHLWQNRFYSTPLDDEHLLMAMRYVEQNPLRAAICTRPWEYAWSSAAVHCGWRKPAEDNFLDTAAWQTASGGMDWADVLRVDMEPEPLKRVRHCTTTGRPLAGDKWLNRLESTLKRSLRSLPPGRPRKRK